MGETLILRGRHLLTDLRLKAAGLVTDGAVAMAGGLVVDSGPFSQVANRHPGARGGRRHA